MEGVNRNDFIFAKLDGLEYFSWRNTGTEFHCHQLTMPPNERAVRGSPFDKVMGKDGINLMSCACVCVPCACVCAALFSMCVCVCGCVCVCVCVCVGVCVCVIGRGCSNNI
jgi:hypothetical protein